MDTELFFSQEGGRDRGWEGVAKGICSGCAVRNECLQYALDNDECHGIYGGMNPQERRRK